MAAGACQARPSQSDEAVRRRHDEARAMTVERDDSAVELMWGLIGSAGTP